jgi:hypothetical protein
MYNFQTWWYIRNIWQYYEKVFIVKIAIKFIQRIVIKWFGPIFIIYKNILRSDDCSWSDYKK